MMSNVPKLRFKEFSGEWIEKKLKSILLDFRLGGNYSNSETINSKPLIKMGNLNRGNIVLNKIEYIADNENIDELDRIKYGDLFFNTRNTLDLVGKVAIWKNELPDAYYNSNLMWMKYENNFFMNYRFNTFQGIKALRRIATGTTSVAAIYTKDLLKISFNVPEGDEQEKIASFLASVDRKIEQLTKKEELLQQYKKGVMQKIFNQEIRFKADDGSEFCDWEEYTLNDFLIPTLREVEKPKENYLAIGVRSHCKGTFQKPDSEPDKIAMDRLYVVKENDLIVNITFAWESAIAIVKKEDEGGLVSHRFPTYTFDEKISNSKYFQYVIIQKRFRIMLDLISPGGAGRNRVMSKKDFLTLKWELPCIEEQNKIANFLSSIDTKIQQTQKQLESSKEFKKALFQQMFV